MAITAVTEIPKPNHEAKLDKPAGYYRPLIYNDIHSAFSEKIAKFEFIGYDTKPEYLAQLARDEAYKVCEELVYAPARKYVKKILADEFGKENVRVNTPHKFSPNSIIKIHGVTLADGVKHIYGQIDFKCAKEYKKTLIELARKDTQYHIEMEQHKAERRKLKCRVTN